MYNNNLIKRKGYNNKITKIKEIICIVLSHRLYQTDMNQTIYKKKIIALYLQQICKIKKKYNKKNLFYYNNIMFDLKENFYYFYISYYQNIFLKLILFLNFSKKVMKLFLKSIIICFIFYDIIKFMFLKILKILIKFS